MPQVASISGTKKSSHPSYAIMVEQGLSAMKHSHAAPCMATYAVCNGSEWFGSKRREIENCGRAGTSRQTLLKYVMKNYKVSEDEKVVSTHLRLALKIGLEKGLILQTSGIGASGSFKLNTKAASAKSSKATDTKPKAAVAVKKPKTTAAATAATKKTVTQKKASVGSTKATKPLSLSKVSQRAKSTAKVAAAPKTAPKKASVAKAKATTAKVAKPKVTKAAVSKTKKK